MSSGQIREAETTDVAEIQSVATAGWRETYDEILAEETIENALAEWYEETGLRGQIENDTVGYFVAEVNESVVGYCSGSTDGSTAVLGALYVVPDRWGAGFGTALLERFERWAREQGCTDIQIAVLADNDVGSRFYEARGYSVQDRETEELFGEEVSIQLFGGPLEG
ncbi:N-acetyltransferase family protein [Halovenus halobia]|uniref:GNAT family N-acetyltransferase n=1 Tax=Halovenus halobia TaxID=3396622 RepID=UPI003F544BA3